MKDTYMHRVPASCYGLCFLVGAMATGCIDNGNPADLDNTEATASSAVTFTPNTNYSLVGVQSNKCLGVVGGSTASFARIEIRTCNGTATQRFRPESMGSGFFRMRNELSGLCLDVSGGSTTAGAAVIQFACGTQINQQWAFTDVAGGAERVTARHSGQVMDVTGAFATDGTLLEQWPSNGGTNQQFRAVEQLPAFAP